MEGKFNEDEEFKPVKIDIKDRKILSLLSRNSRIPITVLSRKIKSKRDSANYRIERMRKKGIILKFYPVISLKKLGYSIFHVFLLLNEQRKEERLMFLEELKKNKNLLSLIEYSDRWDLELVLVAKNLKEFDRIITKVVTKHPDLIIEKEKCQVIKSYIYSPLPKEFVFDKTLQMEKDDDEIVKVDQKDLELLKMISEDCCKSSYKIGEQLKLSPDTVRYRLKGLIEKKAIKSYSVMVDLTKLNYHWYTLAMDFKKFDEKDEAKFFSFVNQHPLIIRAVKLLGRWDLLIYLVSQNPKELHNTVKDIKNTFASILSNFQTWEGYKEHIFRPFPNVVLEK